VHLVGFIVRIYHDARSRELKIREFVPLSQGHCCHELDVFVSVSVQAALKVYGKRRDVWPVIMCIILA